LGKMEIFGLNISFRRKPTLSGNEKDALAQAQTEGMPTEGAEKDPSRWADPEAGHGGYYPPVKGLTPVENHLKHSDIVNKQLEGQQLKGRENMGSFLREGR
jgi:hypothetical protein